MIYLPKKQRERFIPPPKAKGLQFIFGATIGALSMHKFIEEVEEQLHRPKRGGYYDDGSDD